MRRIEGLMTERERERVNMEVERISKEEVGVNMKSRPVRHNSGSMDMSRRVCWSS